MGIIRRRVCTEPFGKSFLEALAIALYLPWNREKALVYSIAAFPIARFRNGSGPGPSRLGRDYTQQCSVSAASHSYQPSS